MPDRPLPPADDLELLLGCLPERVSAQLRPHPRRDALLEVVLDLGRLPEARFPGGAEDLGEAAVSREDLAQVVARVGRFGKDNRAGIERTLHRISAIRNRVGDVVGLTCRVGRALRGTVDVVRDKIEGGCSILLLGRPGVGKTTLLREAARVLADELAKRVVVVDTSNEIAGDGDIPHPAIGRARRMQVAVPEAQHAVMIEAVENHMPEVVVIDEIGTEAEAAAARTIAERGVQLVATAHGVTLDNLLANPTLSDLVGGVHVVTLSDEEARRRGSQKTVLERKAPPTFEVLIEIQDRDRLAVHEDVAEVVDLALRGIPPRPELRVRTPSGEVEVTAAPASAASRPAGRTAQREPSPVLRVEEVFAFPPAGGEPPPAARSAVGRRRGAVDRGRRGNGGPYPLAPPIAPTTPWRTPLVIAPPAPSPGGGRRILRIHPYAVSRSRLEKLLADFGLPVRVVRDPDEADLLLTVKAQERRQPRRLREAMARGMRVVVLKANTGRQIEEFLREEFAMSPRGGVGEREGFALREVEEAIDEAMASGSPVELAPQERAIRRLQHLAIERAGLASISRGAEPERRVVVMPG